MKVLLKVDVDNLGFAGEVRKVADGYGRNYLIPQGLAVKASATLTSQAESWRKQAEIRRAEQRKEFETLSERIREVHLNFTARAGGSGKLYGSITTAQIADELNAALGLSIDRRKVGAEALRQLGDHQVVVRLNADFQPEFVVSVVEEGAEEEEAEIETAVAEIEVEAEEETDAAVVEEEAE